MYRTAEECFYSYNFKQMMFKILEYLLKTSTSYPFKDDSIEIAEVVFNFALPPGHDVNHQNLGIQFGQVSFTNSNKIMNWHGDVSECNDGL